MSRANDEHNRAVAAVTLCCGNLELPRVERNLETVMLAEVGDNALEMTRGSIRIRPLNHDAVTGTARPSRSPRWRRHTRAMTRGSNKDPAFLNHVGCNL